MRETCLNEVYRLAQRDRRVDFIGSDLGFKTLENFRNEFPDRFFMEGISEAHVVGMAAGMALEGRVVYVNTISTFLTRRCFEQVAIDACLHKLNIRFIGNGGGVVYAPLGPTHLAIEDIAIFRALPNMTIVAPADSAEMERLMPLTLDWQGPMYIRLAKGYDPIVSNEKLPFEIGRGITMKRGGDALLITTGITLQKGLAAAEILERSGIRCTVFHMPTIKPLDVEGLFAASIGVKAIVVVEEHSVIGGLGSAVAEFLIESGVIQGKRFKRIGFPDVFPDKYGTQNELMNYYGINEENIVSSVIKMQESGSA